MFDIPIKYHRKNINELKPFFESWPYQLGYRSVITLLNLDNNDVIYLTKKKTKDSTILEYKYHLDKERQKLLDKCIPKLQVLGYHYKIKYSPKRRIPNSLIIKFDLNSNFADSIILILNNTIALDDNNKNTTYRIVARSSGFPDYENSKYSKHFIPTSYVNSFIYTIGFILGQIKRLFK